MNYVVITPARDEMPHIERTIESMVKQAILPMQWIIVDDGSSDGTSEALDAFAETYPWITVVHRNDRGYRAPGLGVMEAFETGYRHIRPNAWEFITKLDADLSFDSDYFERCLECFTAEPKLGIGGGMVCRLESGRAVVDSRGDPPFHVRGATKIYRRACWEQIGPLVKAPGWDTIDEVKANFFGWTSRTFADIATIQHKPTGSADGRWRNWFKNGVANYMTGYHPVFMVAKCARRAFRRPFLVESAALMAGFFSGYVSRARLGNERDVIRFLRREQMRYLFQRPSIYG